MPAIISNPFPLFFDSRGRPLTGGKVYIGVAGQDPELNPITVYLDSANTLPATQPVATIGGLITNGGNPVLLHIAETQYSIRVRDTDNAEVFYLATANTSADEFQPASTELTAIAALTSTTFGRSLLEQASAATARATLGIPDALPIAGGSMTGSILRSAAGAHPYMASTDYPTVRIFVTANGAADPRTQVGDIWLEEEA